MEPLSRVLIVDDDEVCRIILYQVLYKLGYEVSMVNNGHEALLLLHEQDFQAVFTDVEMPEMTGLELLREIRTGLGRWSFPVFMVTSLNDEKTKLEASELTVAGFITKPFTSVDIAQAIKQAMPS